NNFLKVVRSPDDADYYLVFCPISSRVGTDVSEAMEHLPGEKYDKAAVLVVMHHTFNPDQVIPPSRRLVTDQRVHLTLDCLFHQNKLLDCEFNKKMKAMSVRTRLKARTDIQVELEEGQGPYQPTPTEDNDETETGVCLFFFFSLVLFSSWDMQYCMIEAFYYPNRF
uniref:Uncharacterized protein n=1 Tax=Salarias fasciatus TaxID=181472 RepID=A0A672I9D4_SALFA